MRGNGHKQKSGCRLAEKSNSALQQPHLANCSSAWNASRISPTRGPLDCKKWSPVEVEATNNFQKCFLDVVISSQQIVS
jgi:hypothetical protein